MNERLWSPAMRKWANDAHRHGIDIGFTKHRPSRQDAGWAGGGTGGIGPRITDDNAYRIADDSTDRYPDVRIIDNG